VARDRPGTDHLGQVDPGRRPALASVADLLPEASRPLLVAVDGPDGVGKTHFADELALVLGDRGREVVRASVDDFHEPREHRHALGRDAHTVWTRSFDYRALRRELLDPWLAGAGSSYRAAWHDVRRDEHVDAAPLPVPDRGVLVVDGVFTQRPELEHAWDLVVYLDAPPEVTVVRLAARDGSAAEVGDPDNRRYLDAQRIYFETCFPRQKADVVIDNTQLTEPQVVAPGGSTPDGWTLDDGALVRSVRLPAGAVTTARAISALESDALTSHRAPGCPGATAGEPPDRP
jgi:uridine kinase